MNDGFDAARQIKARHGGSAVSGGLAATLKLKKNIPVKKGVLDDDEKNAVLRKLREVYTSKDEWKPMWAIARDHLKKLQSQGYLEGLTIPD